MNSFVAPSPNILYTLFGCFKCNHTIPKIILKQDAIQLIISNKHESSSPDLLPALIPPSLYPSLVSYFHPSLCLPPF